MDNPNRRIGRDIVCDSDTAKTKGNPHRPGAQNHRFLAEANDDFACGAVICGR